MGSTSITLSINCISVYTYDDDGDSNYVTSECSITFVNKAIEEDSSEEDEDSDEEIDFFSDVTEWLKHFMLSRRDQDMNYN